ncbi:MAG: hypothetical protein CMP67_07050 [Flavobacteriales bacterium]|nr:hypothetical protein [Flavobacteriales bacterium]MBO72854.1 hypothetical protein [Flavobacteriales bacterium]|tara:strand:+ start:452 stop:919 length:468 start_codon:yes stop_codon:yes gene_type:complete
MKNIIQNTTKAILIVLPLLFNGCKIDLPKNSKPILKLEKSKCFGDCAMYSAVLKENSWLEFYPKENTKIKSPSYSKIKKTDYKSLLNIINSIPVKNLKSEYDNKLLMDAPTIHLTFYKGQNKRRIKIRANPPKKLKVLIKQFEQIIKSSEWKPLP